MLGLTAKPVCVERRKKEGVWPGLVLPRNRQLGGNEKPPPTPGHLLSGISYHNSAGSYVGSYHNSMGSYIGSSYVVH